VLAVLRDDALRTELAGVREDGCAITVEVLAVSDARRRRGDEPFELCAPRADGAALRTAAAVIDGEAVYSDGIGLAIFDRLHSRVYDDQVILYSIGVRRIYTFPGFRNIPQWVPLLQASFTLRDRLTGAHAHVNFNGTTPGALMVRRRLVRWRD
jgi:hypothetical protein